MGLPARGARAFPGNLEEANRAGMIPKIRVRTSECSTHLYWRTFMRYSPRPQAKIEKRALLAARKNGPPTCSQNHHGMHAGGGAAGLRRARSRKCTLAFEWSSRRSGASSGRPVTTRLQELRPGHGPKERSMAGAKPQELRISRGAKGRLREAPAVWKRRRGS